MPFGDVKMTKHSNTINANTSLGIVILSNEEISAGFYFHPNVALWLLKSELIYRLCISSDCRWYASMKCGGIRSFKSFDAITIFFTVYEDKFHPADQYQSISKNVWGNHSNMDNIFWWNKWCFINKSRNCTGNDYEYIDCIAKQNDFLIFEEFQWNEYNETEQQQYCTTSINNLHCNSLSFSSLIKIDRNGQLRS